MKRESLKSLGLSDDVIDKIMMEHGNSVNSLKSKQTELEGQLDTYKQRVSERDQQLETLKKAAGDSEKLQAQITKLQEENKKSNEAYENQIKQMRLDSAVDLALTNAGVKDIKFGRVGVNLDNIKMDGDKLYGLDEQIAKLKESAPYLFNGDVKPNISGTKPAEGNGKTVGAEPAKGSYEYFVKMADSGQI